MYPLSVFSFQYRNLFFGVAVGKTAAPTSNIILEYYIIRVMIGTKNHCKIRFFAVPMITVLRKSCYSFPKKMIQFSEKGATLPQKSRQYCAGIEEPAL